MARKTSALAVQDWLRKLQDEAKLKGLDELTMEEIDAEIASARRDRKERLDREQN